MKKTVLLYSGGLDSYIASKIINPDINLYINIQSKYADKEINNLSNLDIDYIIDDRLDLSIEEMNNSIVPMRNLFFVMIGLYYGNEIMLAATLGGTSNDKDYNFITKSKDLLSYILKEKSYSPTHIDNNIEIKLPIKEYTKTDLVEMYLKKGYKPEMLYRTLSCYSDDNGSCGDCKSCFRKAVSFVNNNIYKPELFNKNPFENTDKFIKDIGRENDEINKAINYEARK